MAVITITVLFCTIGPLYRTDDTDPELSPLGNPLVWLALAFLVLNTRHFAMQNLGILALYGSRLGYKYQEKDRKYDKKFSLAVGLVLIPLVMLWARVDFGVVFYLVPGFLVSETFAQGIVLLSLGLTVAILIRELRLQRFSWPRALAVLMVGAQPLLFFLCNPILYVLVSRFQHWTAESGLTHWLSRNKLYSENESRYLIKNRSGVGRNFVNLDWVWTVSLILFGGVLMYSIKHWNTGILYITQTAIVWNETAAAKTFQNHTSGVLTGLYMSLIFLHHLYDPILYRSTSVRHLLGLGKPRSSP